MDFELDDTKKYLVTVAMFCLNYSEYLKIDSKRQTDTLGIVLRLYQEKLKKHTPQETSLLITILSYIKEEYFLEYIDLFNKEILNTIITNSKTIEEQIEKIKYIEEKYYEFDSNKLSNLLI